MVKDLVAGKESDVHASRLKVFADSDLLVTAEMLEHVAAQGVVLDVKAIKEHRWSSLRRDYELLISWRGLEEIEDSWEPFVSIARDVRVLVESYVRAAADNQLLEHWNKL